VYAKLTEGLAGMAPGLDLESLPLWLIALGLVVLPLMKPVFLCLLVLLLLAAVLLLLFRRKKTKPKTGITWAFLLVSALPVLWYVVAVNPTIIHFYFQYRGIGVTLLGGFTALLVHVNFMRLGSGKE
jgi:4-amino-4-deoxy-L-arabinose transferase-like glycosyltransferase